MLLACPQPAPPAADIETESTAPASAPATAPASASPAPTTTPAAVADPSPAERGQLSFDPEHEVLTPSGRTAMDKRPVSGLEYSSCVDDGICTRPPYDRFNREPDYRDEPAMSINWYMARTYCDYVGRRLPTLAEYEETWRQLRWLGCCARNAIPREWVADEPDAAMGTQVRKRKGRLQVLRARKQHGVDSATVRCARDLSTSR